MRTSGPAAPTRDLARHRWWAALAAGTLLLAGCTPDAGGGDGADGGDPSPTASSDGPVPTQGPLPEDVGGYAGDIKELWATSAVTSEGPVGSVWITDGAVVAVTSGRVSAHAPGSGEELWRLEPPAGTGRVCRATPAVNGDGVGAVVYTSQEGSAQEGSAQEGSAQEGSVQESQAQDRASCAVIAAVDTRTGDVLWSRDLDRPGAQPFVSGLTVGETVITADLGVADGLFRFATEGGEELPALDVPGAETCAPYGWGLSAGFSLAVTGCSGTGGHVFDTESGELLFPVPGPVLHEEMMVAPGDRLAYWQDETLVVLDDDGEVTTEITVPDGRDAGTAAVVTDSVVVGLSGAEGSTSRYPVYAGWDLETGRRLWEEELPGDDWYPDLWYPVGDDRILVSYPAWVDRANHRVYTDHLGWLDPRDGSLTDAGTFADDADNMTYDLATDGRLLHDAEVVYALTRPGDRTGRAHLVAYELPG